MKTGVHLSKRIEDYRQKGLLRRLEAQNQEGIDFYSNDYLGFARSETYYENFLNSLQEYQSVFKLGSTGSRLISGNLPLFKKLEQEISQFHKADAGLIFNSGYNANLGVFSSIPQRGDVILYDILCHASIRDGIRLSFADHYSFQHNDTHDLKKKLDRFNSEKGNIYIAVESLYSMEGDFAPIEEIVFLCEKYQADLIIDEAHSNGIVGKKGEGLVRALNLEDKILARVHTFGKALGCHGAIVLGSKLLKNFLASKARSFIYTTAMGNYDLLAIRCSYEYLKKNPRLIDTLNKTIALFRSLIPKELKKYFLDNVSPIQSFIPGRGSKMPMSKQKIKKIADKITKKGINIKVILSPTVPNGEERIRICIHSFNSEEEMRKLISTISRALAS